MDTIKSTPLNQEKKGDEIDDLQDSKNREQNTARLLSMLCSETEILANTKVKETITLRTLEVNLFESKQLKDSLKSINAELTSHKEKLEEQIKLESIYRSQIEKEVDNTEKMFDIVRTQYNEIETRYQSKLAIISNLETLNKTMQEQYTSQKEDIQKIIHSKKMNIIKALNKKESENLQFETEMNKKFTIHKKLNERNNDLIENIEKRKNEIVNLDHEFNTLNSKLLSLKESVQLIQNTATRTQLEIKELEDWNSKFVENCSITTNALENDISVGTKTLEELSRKETVLIHDCSEVSDTTSELEKLLKKLEDENSMLSEEQDVLVQRKTLINIANEELNNSRQEYDILSTQFAEASEVKLSIALRKENRIKYLQSVEETKSDYTKKIADLTERQNEYEKQEIDNSHKIENLKEEQILLKSQIASLESTISAIHQNRILLQEAHDQVITDFDSNISVSQSEHQEATLKYETTVKNLNNELDNYKFEQKRVYEQNEENHKEILEGFRSQIETLENVLQEKKKNLDDTNWLISEKKALLGKCTENVGNFNEEGSSKKSGILKSPGKLGISPKKVTFGSEIQGSDKLGNTQQTSAINSKTWDQLLKDDF